MPKRKFNANGKKGKHSQDTSAADADENQEDEEEMLASIESGEANKSTEGGTLTTVDAHV